MNDDDFDDDGGVSESNAIPSILDPEDSYDDYTLNDIGLALRFSSEAP